MNRAAVIALRALVRGYQLLVRPVLPPACRFEPSCSEYCLQALAAYGALRGTALALGRIGRCHPWHRGGHDPLPDPEIRHRGARGA